MYKIESVYRKDGSKFIEHYYERDKKILSKKYNKFGDIISYGNFKNSDVFRQGCKYNFESNCWVKSPFFKLDAKVYGLGCKIDVRHNVIFYGIMFGNVEVCEYLIEHPYLKKELYEYRKYQEMAIGSLLL